MIHYNNFELASIIFLFRLSFSIASAISPFNIGLPTFPLSFIFPLSFLLAIEVIFIFQALVSLLLLIMHFFRALSLHHMNYG
jgi:hypothetical protein